MHKYTDFIAQLIESLCDVRETVHSFMYLGSKFDFNGDCQAAVTVRTRTD